MMALFAGGLTYAGVPPSAPIVLGAALVVGLLTLAARAATENLAALWLASSVAGFALLLAYTFGVALPQVEQIWPARRIAEAIEPLRRCTSGPVSLLGFREPSSAFLLGRDSDNDVGAIAKRMAAREPGIAVVEDRWAPDLAQALAQHNAKPAERAGCVTALNTMRGCPLSFSIYLTGPQAADPGCHVEPRFACTTPLPAAPEGAGASAAARISPIYAAQTLSRRARTGYVGATPVAAAKERPMDATAFNPENPPELKVAQWFNTEPLTLGSSRAVSWRFSPSRCSAPLAPPPLPQAQRLARAFNDDQVAVLGRIRCLRTTRT